MNKIYETLGRSIYTWVAIFAAGVGSANIMSESYLIGAIAIIISIVMVRWLTEEIERQKHENLKLELWKKFKHNRDAYTEAKSKFVKKHTTEAKILYKNKYE